MTDTTIYVIVHAFAVTLTILRVLLRPRRDPEARIAWIAVIGLVPVLGILIYIFFGEVDLGPKYLNRMQEVKKLLQSKKALFENDAIYQDHDLSEHYQALFKLGKSINGFDPVSNNKVSLIEDADLMIESLIHDIDAAKDHVHLLSFIWLPDKNGLKVVDALIRAASRGIKCRVLVDNMGSVTMIQSKHWDLMKEAGVQLAVSLPVFRSFSRRIDLRNHRKIIVIDGSVTYCGSQNCCDAEFLPKANYAPWVDLTVRLEGPAVMQNQYLFVNDWMATVDDDISDLVSKPVTIPEDDTLAQAIGTGPTNRHLAMSQVFVALIASAQKDLIITTPYFIPDEAIQSALEAAAYRGVNTTIVLPKSNDSWIVQCASKSYYRELLEAGVQIYEFYEGLLHAKSVTVDGEFMMLGSANLDRRSFNLNYENNLLIYDNKLVSDAVKIQQQYISKSDQVTKEMVSSWSIISELWNNTIAILGPIL